MALIGSLDQAKSMCASYQNVLLKANFTPPLPLNETLSASDAPAIMIPVLKFPPRLKEKAWFSRAFAQSRSLGL